MKTPSCGGGSAVALRLKPGAWRNGTARALDHADQAQRAGALRHDPRAGDRAGSATAPCTDGTQARPSPRQQRAASTTAATSSGGRPAPRAAAFEPRDRRGGEPQRADQPQCARPAAARTAAPRIAEASRARAQDVEAVDAVRPAAPNRANAMHTQAPAQRKGNDQQQVDGQQAQRLARVPEDFQRIERHPLREQEAADRADAEQPRRRATNSGAKRCCTALLRQRRRRCRARRSRAAPR